MNLEEESKSVQAEIASFNSFYKNGNTIILNYSIDNNVIINKLDIELVNNIKTCNIDHHILIYGLHLFPTIFYRFNPNRIAIKASKLSIEDLNFWNEYYNKSLNFFFKKNNIVRKIHIENPIETIKSKLHTIIYLPKPKDKMDLILRLSCLKGEEHHNKELKDYNHKLWKILERDSITWDQKGLLKVYRDINNILIKHKHKLDKCSKSKNNPYSVSNMTLSPRGVLYNNNDVETAMACEIIKKAKIGVDLVSVISGDISIFKYIYKTKQLVNDIVEDTNIDSSERKSILERANNLKKDFTKILTQKKGSYFDKMLSNEVFDSMVHTKKIGSISKIYNNNTTKSIEKLLISYKFGKTTQLNHHFIFSNIIGITNLYNLNYNIYPELEELNIFPTGILTLFSGLRDASYIITPFSRYDCVDPDPKFIRNYKFESSFNSYLKLRLNTNISYFSIIRPFYLTQLYKIIPKFIQYYYILFNKCDSNKPCMSCDICMYNFVMVYPFMKTDDLLYYTKHNILDKPDMLDILLKITGTKPKIDIYNQNNLDTIKQTMFCILLISEKKEDLPYLVNHFIKKIPELCKVKKYRDNFFKNFGQDHSIPTRLNGRIRQSVDLLLRDDIEEFNYKLNTKFVISKYINKKDILVLLLLVIISIQIYNYVM